MGTEDPNSLSTSSGPCTRKASDTTLSGPPSSPTRTVHGQSSACVSCKPPSRIALIISGSWYMELVCMFLSAVVFGFYCWFLSYHNGKGSGELNYYEWLVRLFKTLQSALSQISTVLRLLMFVPVSSAMGQLGWHQFWDSTSRPVSDLQTFDAASRGLSGAVRLLLSRHTL